MESRDIGPRVVDENLQSEVQNPKPETNSKSEIQNPNSIANSDPCLLALDQQQRYLDLLSRGASPAVICRELGVTPAAVRQTLAVCEEFRTALNDVALQLNQNVATAVYVAAMKGNVSAQALWLKYRPPPGWTGDDDAPGNNGPGSNDRNSPTDPQDFDALTNQELVDLAREAGVAIPAELEDGAD